MFTLGQNRNHTLSFRYEIICKDLESHSLAPCCDAEDPLCPPSFLLMVSSLPCPTPFLGTHEKIIAIFIYNLYI